MKLRELLEGVDVRSGGEDFAAEVTSVTADSRQCQPGSLFVAIPGLQQDGALFIDSAVRKGAVVIVGESAGPSTFILVDDARKALAQIAANFYGRPARKLSLIGVTGTSGKTTTTKMIESILDATGQPVGLIGTIEYRAGEIREIADRTTPDAVVLQEWFARMVSEGVKWAVMEVSSHALALHRTKGVPFAVAVFTNLTRDHFDFHQDFEQYFAAKKILFEQIDRSAKTAVINIDDPYGRRLAGEIGHSAVMTVGLGEEAEVHPEKGLKIDLMGLDGRVATPLGSCRLQSPLVGRPNLYNWLSAIGAAILAGIDLPTIERGITALPIVRGRFERVVAEGAIVLIDYAHKPDALEKLLTSVRELAPDRKLVLVFGCGGDRDQGKRAIMGEIAGRLADVTIITSDNPRSENPASILAAVEQGIRKASAARYEIIADRRRAIERGIAHGNASNVVVIAGKGHETYQVIGDEILHFDDREEALQALARSADNGV